TKAPVEIELALETWARRDGDHRFAALGNVVQRDQVIGTIEFDGEGAFAAHPVVVALNLIPEWPDPIVDVASRTLAHTHTTAPESLVDFAAVSGDANPIHRSMLAARLAGLDQPIVHGMWTAA